ncbi:MAG TPA: hypothetical protein VFR86_10005 [Burkholderiaceae bacterium]|nr:hypothetical protein [Burkholderiaceae bacterium]
MSRARRAGVCGAAALERFDGTGFVDMQHGVDPAAGCVRGA